MITIATWNVNSVKSRIQHLLDYLRSDEAPDILLLQEIKCITEAFPSMEVEDCGYNIAVHGQKTYNGVAILSKYPIEDVNTELAGEPEDEQARFIEAVICAGQKAIRVANVYVPNGQSPDSEKFQYKMRFFDRLYEYAKKCLSYEEPFLIGGDYNVAPYPELDVYAPKSLEGTICCHRQEREKFRKLTGLGMIDAFRLSNPHTQQYSWWDYRGGSWQQNKGMRIDHILLSPEAADMVTTSGVNQEIRGLEKPSDHAPVWVRARVS
ncbi:exodeoxyribonuclease III [Rickettsiales bacterium]|nr:exodeoxyribonuclease III [Rickettsiales bacterium]